MPKLIEIKDGAEYTVDEYSVWLEVSIDAEDEDRKVLIHPSAFDSLTKAMAKANEIAGLDGDKATTTKEWDTFVLSQECKGAKFGRTSRYASKK